MNGSDFMDEKLIDTLAKLSSVEISPGERESLLADMRKIVSYVRRLEGLELEEDDLPAQPAQNGNGMQPDTPRSGLEREAAFQNAPDACGMFVKAPPIIER